MGFLKKIFGDAADELKKNFEDAKKEMRNNLEEIKQNAKVSFIGSASNLRDNDENSEEPALENKPEIEEKPDTPANGGLFSARLEAMISAALQDGVLTHKERELLKRRVEKEGEDWNEVEMIIESRIQEAEDLASNESAFFKKNNDEERLENTINLEQLAPESVIESNPESTKTVIDEVFSPSLEERHKDTIIVPEGVTTIPEMECFNNSFQSVVFPSTLVKIEKKSFENCERLKSVDFSRCKNLLEIEECAFCECKSLKEIILPDTVRFIGESAFSGLEECEKIVMPASLELICDSAFHSCGKLTTIDFSRCEELKDIGSCAFCYCESLKEIVLPSSLKKIGQSAFCSCQLKGIDIPDSVEYIGSDAFSSNMQLVAATIGVSAKDYFNESSPIFNNTPNLKELTFKSEVAEYTGAKALTKVTFCDTVKALGMWALAGCEELEEIIVPDSVTKIGYGAFAGCTNLRYVALSDNITEIADCSLANTKVKEIVFPCELRQIGILGEGLEKLRRLDFSKVTQLRVIPEYFIGDNTPHLKEIVLPVGVTKIEECIGGINLSRLFLPPSIEEVEDLHQIKLDIYCFAPKLDELGMMVESIEEPDGACHLFVLPEFFDAYKAQRDAEGISETILTIDVIPEEFRYYYDK